jgi:hypothetical protein
MTPRFVSLNRPARQAATKHRELKYGQMRILLIAAFSLSHLYAAGRIAVYESTHFELITDGSKPRAQQIVGQFERVRSFLNQVMPLEDPLLKPLIVVFGSGRDFREYAPNEVAAAYYAPIPQRDIIAIGAPGAGDDQRISVHEYLHLLMRYTGSDLPLWMQEGIAELYSTIQPHGKQIQVGAPVVNHLHLLQNEWMELDQVVNVDPNSPVYNRRAHAGTFYASSWALVHMLHLGSNYKAGYTKFVAAAASGQRAEQALLAVYGKTLKQVDADLHRYVRERRLNTLIFDLRFDRSSDQIPPRDANAYEWDLARTYLMIATRRYDQAGSLLEVMVKGEPGRSDAWEGIAFLNWISRAKGSRDRAAAAFAKALDLGSTNPNLAFYSTGLTEDVKLVGTSLQSLVDRYPTYVEGRIRLAQHLLHTGNVAGSYDQIKQVKKISRRQAPLYFPVLIQTSWRLKKLEECRAAASQFKGLARTEAERTAANTWFAYAMHEPADRPLVASLESSKQPLFANHPTPLTIRPPTEFELEDFGLDVVKDGDDVRLVGAKATFIEGTLINLECKDPQAILSIQHPTGLIRLLIEDPTNVNLKLGTVSKMELTCGPQSNPVKAGYFPRINAAENTSGALATLEFMK